MSDDSNGGRSAAFPEGFAVPITGLLSVLFAMMAGMTVPRALSGSPGELALPVIFGAASLLCFHLMRRSRAART